MESIRRPRVSLLPLSCLKHPSCTAAYQHQLQTQGTRDKTKESLVKNVLQNIKQEYHVTDEPDIINPNPLFAVIQIKLEKDPDPQQQTSYNADDGDSITGENDKSPHMHVNSDLNTNLSNVRQFFCFLCTKICALKSELNLHIRNQHQTEHGIICPQCTITFTMKKTLIQHMKASHGFKRMYNCDKCDKRYTRLCYLKIHQSVTHGGIPKYQCSLCDKRFCHRSILKRHREIHQDEYAYPCDRCEKRFKSKDILQSHKLTHENEFGRKEMKCDLCEFKTCRKSSMRYHLTTHGVGPMLKHKCEKCGKTFCKKSSLEWHIYQSHSKEKRFKCDKCNRSYRRNRQLKKHVLQHTGKEHCACHLCGHRFEELITLDQHLVTVHVGQQPFRCDKCDNRYERKWELNIHVQSKHAEAEICEICGKRISHTHMRRHMKTIHFQSGRLFTCDECGKSFKEKSNLARHMRVHLSKLKYLKEGTQFPVFSNL